MLNDMLNTLSTFSQGLGMTYDHLLIMALLPFAILFLVGLYRFHLEVVRPGGRMRGTATLGVYMTLLVGVSLVLAAYLLGEQQADFSWRQWVSYTIYTAFGLAALFGLTFFINVVEKPDTK